MSIKFQITTGLVWINGVQQATTAYSGHGDGLNNPDMENVEGVGPIPEGLWNITTWFDHPHLGPMVSHLTPSQVPNTFGRSGFFIHGDNAEQNHSASDGCIIMNHYLRQAVKDSGQTQIWAVR